MEFTKIEQAVLTWIASHSGSLELQEQLRLAQSIDREYTGAGSYTTLRTSCVTPLLPCTAVPNPSRGPLSGPEIRSAEIENGACSLLWFKEGYIECLELASYGNSFPEKPKAFTLHEGNE